MRRSAATPAARPARWGTSTRRGATSATFFAGFGPELGADAVEGALAPPLDATTAAIRAFAHGSPKAYARLHRAAKLTPQLAGVLADGIATRYPGRFPAS